MPFVFLSSDDVFWTASLDSTAQTGGTGAGDWQEEVYQKVSSKTVDL